jgi:putative DNA primase/helicase
MQTSEDFKRHVEDVKTRAHGRWPEILLHLGLEPRMIVKRDNLPCPMCGGRDRFQFTDKYGEGNYHCRQCGSGGGFKLAQAVTGMTFNEVLQAVERYLGVMPALAHPSTVPSTDRMKKLARRIWDEARPITPGDEVDRYLRGRGLALSVYPSVLRFHPSLGYYEKDAGKSRKVGEYPAMLACIQGADGGIVSVHRTYLQEGRQLAHDAKKVLSSGINGAAIRLFEATTELAITEGIEKSLAVHLSTHRPTWAALSAGNLEKLWLPPSVTRIWIYGDNDADGDFAGQAFAFALARRLKREGKVSGTRQVEVFIPKQPGTDWSDIWFQQSQAKVRRVA